MEENIQFINIFFFVFSVLWKNNLINNLKKTKATTTKIETIRKYSAFGWLGIIWEFCKVDFNNPETFPQL